MPKTFKLGARLRYPITISKLLKENGDNVSKQEPVLRYTFKFKRTIGDPNQNEEHEIEETGVADWVSPAEGKIKQWRVKIGDVIRRDQDLITVEETCGHEIQYAGLCAICGKDMKEASFASESLDTERATIAMVHDNIALTVSTNQAARAEMQLQRRLLKNRKLSLVVDLDQTIIHACIDRTVGEWKKDESNPNFEAVKDVRDFKLDDGPQRAAVDCTYYIKMRPGLAEFLENISKLFELHVYTMGTRAYALEIAKIVDPTQKLFGNRIISRDENESITAKSLQRLFPVSTNMVVVIDDRVDVWPQNRPNLIKVTPYDFFTGIGDINSSFLPKRQDIIAAPTPPEDKPVNSNPTPAPPVATPDATHTIAGHERALANGSTESALLQQQAEEQERILEKQLKDRPLLRLQEELDRVDETDNKSAENGDSPEPAINGESESSSQHQRHRLLRDDDRELQFLEKNLTRLHHSFYEQYDARSANRRPDDIGPDVIPDVGSTLNFLKSQVLKDTRLVLSGLVPLEADVRRTEIGMHAESFGAEIRTRVSRDITHLVINIARPRTQKVRQAARIPEIKIVNQSWLADCIVQWEKLDETPYLIPENDDEEEELEDRYNVMPPELGDGEHSPIEDLDGMEWGDVDKELEEFMGSDGEDSDMDSMQGTDAGTDTESEEPKGKKRKLDDGEEDDSQATGSALAKKQRIAKARTTGLRNVRNATDDEDAEGSGLPTPMGTGDEEDGGETKVDAEEEEDGDGDVNVNGDENNEDDADEFADLEAELEAALSAENEVG
ncbi:hypothetical protein M426DRAFT_62308 [Hypoxylon sp. CI-4A]|nr:hypothetical protein M426DRAFT_62308 [Hypoxylon sp. CI-4A]